MYCSNCGTYNDKGNFCVGCGAKLETIAQNNTVESNNQVEQSNNIDSQPVQQPVNNQPTQQPVNNQPVQQVNQQPAQQGVGSITLTRPSNFVGVLVPFDVFVDGYLLGSLSDGETKTFPLYYGNHFVQIKQGFNSGTQNIVINDNQRNLVFNVVIEMGFVTNTIRFVFVSFYN